MNVSSCPSCGSRLFRSELKANRCSNCNEPLPDDFIPEALAARATPRGPLTWEEADPSAPAADARVSRAGWGPMNLGLILMYFGLIGHLSAFGVQVLWQLLARQGWVPPPLHGDGRPASLAAALGVFGLVGGLLVLVGALMCCVVPRRVGARGWAVGAALSAGGGLLGIGAAVALVAFDSVLRLGRAELAAALLLAGLAVAVTLLAGSLCFTLLLRAVARFWGDKGLGLQFVIFFLLSWGVPLVALGVVVAAALLAGLRPVADPVGAAVADVVGPLTAVGLLVFSVVMSLWCLRLLARLWQRLPS